MGALENEKDRAFLGKNDIFKACILEKNIEKLFNHEKIKNENFKNNIFLYIHLENLLGMGLIGDKNLIEFILYLFISS
jgi:hypothetical protein